VLNNTAGSSEDTKVVRQVTEVFLHEEFDYGTLINDIAIVKVGIIFKYKNKHFIFIRTYKSQSTFGSVVSQFKYYK